jgi:DNA-directed RNA polymerase I, II, and III subunit RPABC2
MSDIEDNFANDEEYFDEDVDFDFSEDSDDEEKNEDDEGEIEGDVDLENDEVKIEDEYLLDIEDEEDEKDKVIEIEKDENKLYKKVEKKITLPILTKYEKAKIIGLRAIHLSQGALSVISLKNIPYKNLDPLTLAEREFNMKKIPLIIRRHLPNGTFEDWRLEDFKNI